MRTLLGLLREVLRADGPASPSTLRFETQDVPRVNEVGSGAESVPLAQSLQDLGVLDSPCMMLD